MASPRHCTTMENLPYEVLSDIFIRLLAKQLAQMRCVCKPWNALLSETSFTKSHLHHSIHNNDEILMFFRLDFPFDCGSLTTRSSSSPHLELPNFIKLPIKTQSKNSYCSVIGSVNGLVCYCYTSYPDYGIHIWNPSLSAVLTLPPLSLPSDHSHLAFGFGFDPKTNDYKVVQITRHFEPPNMMLQAEVYSMRKGFWGSISQRVPSHIIGIKGFNQVFLHGHIHWLGCNDENGKLETIVAFDVGAETFSKIHLPDAIAVYDMYKFYNVLGVLDGKLCVMSKVFNGECEVWVMDEYGVSESWIKHHAFSQFSGDIIPYGFTSRKEFILRYENNFDCFALYNPVASKTKTFKITMGQCYISIAIEYVDSLVWITPAKQLQI